MTKLKYYVVEFLDKIEDIKRLKEQNLTVFKDAENDFSIEFFMDYYDNSKLQIHVMNHEHERDELDEDDFNYDFYQIVITAHEKVSEKEIRKAITKLVPHMPLSVYKDLKKGLS